MDMPSTLLHWTLSAPLRFSISVFPSRKMEYFCRNNCDCIFLLFCDCCNALQTHFRLCNAFESTCKPYYTLKNSVNYLFPH